jgi:adrenodoxin-NADP+ reductase
MNSSRMLSHLRSVGCSSSCSTLLRRSQRYSSIRSFSSYKIAIVGSGPAGCYTAKYLRSALQKQLDDDSNEQEQEQQPVRIDILERLPTPYGLVRYGVAPDHPAVKNVQNDFDVLFDNDNSIRFFGHVHVGYDVKVEELRELYDAVVLAYGCESDQRLGIEDSLTGILSAREFVAWYNGHVDYGHIGDQVARALGVTNGVADGSAVLRDKHVVVIGQGNVAIDCARILTKGARQLYDTDIASRALPVLGGGVQQVSLLGRRGPVQGAFTIKELRELTQLEDSSFHVQPEELERSMTDASKQELEGGRPKQRIWKILSEMAATQAPSDKQKSINLRFLLSPSSFQPKDDDPLALGSVVCERTTLTGEAGRQRAVGTGELETLPADLALVSIGYKGTPIPGTEAFFDNGIVRNVHGKVDDATENSGGLYASGWLKRGPTGIIGTNITDAKDTVATIVHDLSTTGSRDGATGDLETLLQDRNIEYVSWEGYRKLDSIEKREKRSENQPREKIVDLDLQLKAARSE